MPKGQSKRFHPNMLRLNFDCGWVLDPTSGCHVWVRSVDTNGYGQLNIGKGRPERAHRYAWILANGPVPEGYIIRQQCRNKRCVNVGHLYLATRKGIGAKPKSRVFDPVPAVELADGTYRARTRIEAQTRGLTRYFNGKPCLRGHVAERSAKRGQCIECLYAGIETWRQNNKAEHLARAKRWAKANPERVRANGRLSASRRTKAIKVATPPWADREELRRFYRECPDGYTVDHIIPLGGKNVCGLHVPWNLQYLTPSENAQKGRRFDG